jgi:hypothetical protein
MVAVIIGSLLVLGGLGSAAGGAALLIGNTVARGADGLIRTPTEIFSGTGYGLEFGAADVKITDAGWSSDTDWLGMVQVRAQGRSSEFPLFVGIGPESDVAHYLSDVRVDRVSKIDLFPFTVG